MLDEDRPELSTSRQLFEGDQVNAAWSRGCTVAEELPGDAYKFCWVWVEACVACRIGEMKWSEYLQASDFPFSRSRKVEGTRAWATKGWMWDGCGMLYGRGMLEEKGAAVQDRARSIEAESAKKARHVQILFAR